ncbi:unnamed protein product [Rhizoctonia solani]|uniref:Zn(2)-C6 fungal-type domain-containing protein n=1 Tax=Rhizoctonia solani TaxID=456999 RepID=A0A8H3AYG1_9AGAM|nr:unnamed protein product [Rhizoctonia solani]
MFSVPARSMTGCLACKNKRKKCDEAKPHCLRCQQADIQCPGYIYVMNSSKPTTKLRTLPAPRTLVNRFIATTHPDYPSQSLQELGPQLQGQLSTYYEPVAVEVPNNELDTSVVPDTRTPSEDIDMSNPWVFLSSFSGSLQCPSIDLNNLLGREPKTMNLEPVITLPSIGSARAMTSGQASFLESLFSLENPSDSIPTPQPLHHNIAPPFDSSMSPVSSWPLPGTKAGNEDTVSDDEDWEDVVSTICRVPILDKMAEGNALPYVLQGYATWVRRMAFEPLKMVRIARDFVFGQFAGGEESRWLITLLADIGSRVANLEITDGKYDSVLSMLQLAVRRRLNTANSITSPSRPELAKVLDTALETMSINFFVSPLSDVVVLREEAAPIFRRLCPEPSNTSIDLAPLLVHPLVCLRHYAHIDILFSVIMDMPALFRYNATLSDGQTTSSYESVLNISSESGLQWLHGIPDPFVLLFAKLKLIREDGLKPSSKMVESFEQEIRELQPFKGSSSDSALVIMRFVVQECWRQVAYTYLYMAICGDSANTLRVKEALKSFLKILQGVKPGRFPDDFLVMNLILISPAARRQRDREILRQRIKGIYLRGRTFRANENSLYIIEDYWARANNEKREVMWSDVAVSRKRIMGI